MTAPVLTPAAASGSPAPVRPAPAGPDAARARHWGAGLRGLGRPVGFYVLSRIGVFFAALVAKWLFPKLHPITALGSMWDGSWYLKIAQHGYPAHLVQEGDGSRWAYFPAWPASIRGLSSITGLKAVDAAVVLAFVFGFTSVVAIWLAAREILGPVTADRTVLLYVFFPMSFVLSMGYTEGLFLTAAAGCLFALSKRWWIAAGLCAALGGATRDVGVFLIVAVVVTAIRALRTQWSLGPVAAIGLAPLGLGGFMLFSWIEVGTPFAFLKALKFWDGAHFIWFKAPLYALADVVRGGLHGLTLPSALLASLAVVFAYFGLAFLVRVHRRTDIPLAWWIFTVGALITAFSPYYPNSILRYSMAAFPLFVAYAWRIRPSWDGAVVGMLACAQGALTMIVLIGVVHPMIPVFP